MFFGGTRANRPPVQIILYFICRRNSPHPLVEDGLVESGFLLDVPAWLFDRAGRRSGHIAYLEILDDNHRVVFADGLRSLMLKTAVAPASSRPA